MSLMQKTSAGIRDKISYVPVRLHPCFGKKVLSQATGFFYLHNDKSYLITNWHNVTGRHPQTLKPLSETAAIPDDMAIFMPYKEDTDDKHISGETIFIKEWKVEGLPLYEDEEKQVPVWYEHPLLGKEVDVVAIEIENDLGASDVFYVNDDRIELDSIYILPGNDVFVVGFPKAMTGGGYFPLWKRGSIASEPEIDLDDLPKLLIDTATREGMSGSPVYGQYFGRRSFDKQLGICREFLGVYSGRVGDDTFLAQLGVVWKAKVIDEIITGQKVGRSYFEISAT